MFFKKKKQVDTTIIKQWLRTWFEKNDINVHEFEMFLGDFRDKGTENMVATVIFFETNSDLEKYEKNGLISELKQEIIKMVNDTSKNIVFDFDTHENVLIKCNGNYLKYNAMKNSEK